MPAEEIPTLSGETGLEVLRAMLRSRSVLPGLSVMHARLGSPFMITLPGFRPVVLAGPEANRFVLVSGREHFLWRTETDPVTRLLRHGLLVEDGEAHERLRAVMDPSLHRSQVNRQVDTIWDFTNRSLSGWQAGETRDMLVEMRKAALLILLAALFGEDAEADLERIWHPILKSIEYISPGPWIVWPGIPRPGYRAPLAELDRYLYEMIAHRRSAGADGDDLLSVLIRQPGLDDDAIRDQLLTMLIAGHDTSTALLAWALHLMGQHPEAQRRARAELDEVIAVPGRPPQLGELRRLDYLDAVIKETLRLYPPIHVGNRQAARDVEVQGCPIPAGSRVMYSIYLSHRDPAHWPDPDRFRPERFLHAEGERRPALAYVPFGGGPRNCIGAAFAQVEAKIVLAWILQRFELRPAGGAVRAHMGATLEPRPGVRMALTAHVRPVGEC